MKTLPFPLFRFMTKWARQLRAAVRRPVWCKPFHFVRLGSIFAAFASMVPSLPAQTGTGLSVNSPELQAGGTWRLTWATQAGGRYVLQRSRDLIQWTDVGTVDATGS